MVKNGNNSDHDTAGTDSKKRPEKLVVRWKTCAKENGKGKSMGDYYRNLAGAASQSTLPGRPASSADEAEFSGIFIFEFDEDGRIVSHTIENVQEGGSWDKMPRVISVTDWLLGKAWAKSQGEGAGLALNYCNSVRSGDSVTAKIAGKRR